MPFVAIKTDEHIQKQESMREKEKKKEEHVRPNYQLFVICWHLVVSKRTANTVAQKQKKNRILY